MDIFSLLTYIFLVFRLFAGIGLAMCINAIVRAINCCAVAAIAAVYVLHSVADAKLPFTYCRYAKRNLLAGPVAKGDNAQVSLPQTR